MGLVSSGPRLGVGVKSVLARTYINIASKHGQKVVPKWCSDAGFEVGLGANVLKDRDKTAGKLARGFWQLWWLERVFSGVWAAR